MKTQEEKIEYLRKLLKVYLKFSRHYSKVNLIVSGKDFMVIWSEPIDSFFSFESIECPLSDIDSRIISYKAKVNRYFKKRNNGKL